MKNLFFISLFTLLFSGCTLILDIDENCGNGKVDPNEECDGNNLDGEDCQSLGKGVGYLQCTNECTYDFTACALVD
ncbi:MAG: hypothetical protein JXR95_16190 [Deltaproteobacteria bacterium]|nr:hypothetical protein [Deltaproteobacteria bacterium]